MGYMTKCPHTERYSTERDGISVCLVCENDSLAERLAHSEILLRDFGKAELALDDSEDGLGCDALINEHVRAYVAIKIEAVRLAKGTDHGTDRGTRRE